MSSVIGAALGAVAGYFGGKVDTVLIRVSEIFQAFPQLVLVMMLVAIVNKRGLGNLLFIFVLTGWKMCIRDRFRPDQNAERMIHSAEGMVMPPFPKERFLDALDQVVRANAAWVPPYGCLLYTSRCV